MSVHIIPNRRRFNRGDELEVVVKWKNKYESAVLVKEIRGLPFPGTSKVRGEGFCDTSSQTIYFSGVLVEPDDLFTYSIRLKADIDLELGNFSVEPKLNKEAEREGGELFPYVFLNIIEEEKENEKEEMRDNKAVILIFERWRINENEYRDNILAIEGMDASLAYDIEAELPKELYGNILNKLIYESEDAIKFNPVIFETYGRQAYSSLPGELRDYIRKKKPKHILFILDSFFYWIPFEVFHDGDDFLSVKYSVGRILREEMSPRKSVGGKHYIDGKPKMLGIVSYVDIAESSNRMLKSSFVEECEYIRSLNKRDLLELDLVEILPSKKVLFNRKPIISEETATNDFDREVKDFILGRLQLRYDIIHVVAHGIRGDSYEKNAIIVNQVHFKDNKVEPENQLTAEEISRIELPDAPFVFLNICYGNALGFDINRFKGLGKAFINAGAQAVIAPFGSINTYVSRIVAEKFYREELLKGKITIGEALSLARNETRRELKEEGKSNIDWLYYILIGNPWVRF